MNPFYVFCGSDPSVDRAHQAANLGEHVVEIFNGPRFGRALIEACSAAGPPERELFLAAAFTVSYDKGGVRDEEAARSLKAYFGTKPERFSPDREIRFVMRFHGPNTEVPDYLDVSLAAPQSFCRMLEH